MGKTNGNESFAKLQWVMWSYCASRNGTSIPAQRQDKNTFTLDTNRNDIEH